MLPVIVKVKPLSYAYVAAASCCGKTSTALIDNVFIVKVRVKPLSSKGSSCCINLRGIYTYAFLRGISI